MDNNTATYKLNGNEFDLFFAPTSDLDRLRAIADLVAGNYFAGCGSDRPATEIVNAETDELVETLTYTRGIRN